MDLRIRLSATVLAAAVSMHGLAATAQNTQDPQALAVLSGSYTAMGGANVGTIQDTFTTVQQTGTDDNGNPLTETVTIETAGQNLRLVNQAAGVVVVVNGSQASIQTSSDTTLMSNLSLGNAGVTHLPLFSALTDWSNPQAILQYVGLEQINGVSVYHITMQRPLSSDLGFGDHDQVCDFYIDAQTQFLVRLLYVQRAASDLKTTASVQVDYSNYKLVAGIQVPFSVTYTQDGGTPSPQVVTSFAVNQGTQPSDFQLN